MDSSSRLLLLAGCLWLLTLSAVAADTAYFGLRQRVLLIEDPDGQYRAKPDFLESAYQAAERRRYAAMVEGQQYDVLVVPFTGNSAALDITLRSLMTAHAARAIAQTGQRVLDPYLAAKLLGDGGRKYHPRDINALAKRLHVKHLVWAQVGADDFAESDGPFADSATIMVSLRAMPAPEFARWTEESDLQSWVKVTLPLENSDVDAMLRAFDQQLPVLLQRLGVTSATAAPKKINITEWRSLAFTSTVREASGTQDPVLQAQAALLYGYLAPYRQARTRERFFEKALLALDAFDPAEPHVAMLRARAYMRLGFRVAALSALHEADKNVVNKPATQSLYMATQSAINGNLPDVKAVVAQIEDPLMRALVWLDIATMSQNYGVDELAREEDGMMRATVPGAFWQFLLHRAFFDLDGWKQFNNIQLAEQMHAEAPVSLFPINFLLMRDSLLARYAGAKFYPEQYPLQHIEEYMTDNREALCCELMQVGDIDYWQLMQAIAEDNVLRHVRLYAVQKVIPDKTMEMIRNLHPYFKEHPEMLLLRAKAQRLLARNLAGGEKKDMLERARRDVELSMTWSYYQTPVALDGYSEMWNLPRDSGELYVVFSTDYPTRASYSTGYARMHGYKARETARWRNNTWYAHSAVNSMRYAEGYRITPDELFAQDEPRFRGSPAVGLAWADYWDGQAQPERAMAILRETTHFAPNHWEAYGRIAKAQFESLDAKSAFETAMSYPPFTKPIDVGNVGRANNAYAIGSLFYWAGYFDYAKPLYAIAIEDETYSGGDMAAWIRLQLLDGQLRRALYLSLERAERYDSTYAWRDYLGLMYAFGEKDEAWNTFNDIAVSRDAPHVWESAMVGHRIEGRSLNVIAELGKSYARILDADGDSYFARYLAREAVLDRIPDGVASETVQAFAPDIYVVSKEKNGQTFQLTLRKRRQDDWYRAIGSELGRLTWRWMQGSELASTKSRKVPPSYALFIDGYAALRAGRFSDAYSRFLRATDLYSVSTDDGGFFLPYFAIAAIRTGQPIEASHLIGRSNDADHFGQALVWAAISASEENHEEAMQWLRKAIHVRPHTENRFLPTEYQYAEAVEMIYEFTGDMRYRDELLRWSHIAETFFPWHAWPYTMQAKYLQPGDLRDRAIVMGHYLDRQSARLNSLPQDDIQAALARTDIVNPFRTGVASGDTTH